jgi:putative heme uptake system protein
VTTTPDGNGTDPVTYLLVDGENLDATLGLSVLGRRPAPEERPRWERVLDFAQRAFEHPARGLFFINASSGTLPMSFVQALTAIGYRPVPLSGPPGVKVVDVGIQRTLEAIADGGGHVLLGSHDRDFLPQVQELLKRGRRVGLLGFREFVNASYLELVGAGLQIFDLEDDAQCFNQVLPRLRIIDIDDFDPTAFL